MIKRLFCSTDLGLRAVKKVITVEDFQVSSQAARRALTTATQLVAWAEKSDANLLFFSEFFCILVGMFGKCFVSRRSMKMREESMWQEYHTLRVSDGFRDGWEKFIQQTIGQAASPTFFQYVSHEIFKDLVKEQHELPESAEDQASHITNEEENALRYVSGYVCRKVQGKLKSSAHPQKDDMMLFISDLSGDEWDEARGTENWTNAIDRGGLWHVSDDTYLVFYLMEEDIRKQLLVKSAKTLDAETKRKVLDSVLSNEDLLFHWSLLASPVGDDLGSVVLRKMAELYLTIRGFAFVSSCMELYKQQHKKRTQKSKALRKKLVTD